MEILVLAAQDKFEAVIAAENRHRNEPQSRKGAKKNNEFLFTEA